MTSENQIIANRENAEKSTGPKDTQQTKFNALRHGILGKEVVITTGKAKEDRSEFEALLGQFRDELKPKNIIEESLIEDAVVARWRRRRVIRAEKGTIRYLQDRERLKSPEEKESDKIIDLIRPFPINRSSPATESPAEKTEREGELDEIRNQIQATPNENEIDKFIRYDAHLERQFYRALKLLFSLRDN